MTVDVQLNFSGDNISTYNIYQNTDDFTTALATDVTIVELQSNYQLTANDAASVIRLVPNDACSNYKDIFINFNDTTPSITLTTDYQFLNYPLPSGVSTATTNAGAIFSVYRGDSYISINNGTTWQRNTSYNADTSSAKIVCVNNDKFRVIKASGESFIWLNSGGWMPTTSGASHNITGTILDFYLHNGIYYARTENSIYRSEDGNTFISVLDYTTIGFNINNSIAGYGNTLYATNYEILYKSIDNGLNWTEIATANDYDKYFVSIYVESESNFVVSSVSSLDGITLSWLYSNDGGATLNVSWLPQRPLANNKSAINTIIKIGDVYYFVGSSNLLSYTSDNIFTGTAGSVSEIPNTELTDSGGGGAANGRFNSISLIASENRIVFSKPTLVGSDKPTSVYVGTISNT